MTMKLGHHFRFPDTCLFPQLLVPQTFIQLPTFASCQLIRICVCTYVYLCVCVMCVYMCVYLCVCVCVCACDDEYKGRQNFIWKSGGEKKFHKGS